MVQETVEEQSHLITTEGDAYLCTGWTWEDVAADEQSGGEETLYLSYDLTWVLLMYIYFCDQCFGLVINHSKYYYYVTGTEEPQRSRFGSIQRSLDSDEGVNGRIVLCRANL